MTNAMGVMAGFVTAVACTLAALPVAGARPNNCSLHQCSSPTVMAADCPSPVLYSAPDDCHCPHWYCDQLSATDVQSVCPSGWDRYVNEDGITLCVRVFNKTASWEGASQTCDEHNSDLLNIRTLEQLMYGTSIYDAVLKKIEIDTHKQPHWCGLRLTDGKLYWDSDTPSPDRDRTPNSSSIVRFHDDDWRAMAIDRECMMYTSMSHQSLTKALLTPEFCLAGLPFICSKVIPVDTPDYYVPSQDFLCGGQNGWRGSSHSRRCYKLFSSPVPYFQAEQICVDNEGHLADPRSLSNQRFLAGALSGLANGTAPLAIHVGMAKKSRTEIDFEWGDSTVDSALHKHDIFSLPTETEKCGRFWNPHYAEGRAKVTAVDFSSCESVRPFICSRHIIHELSEAQVNLTVVRDGDALKCVTNELKIHGVFIWKRDQQYFANQPLSPNITLNSETIRFMTDDQSNRTITNVDATGQYACEFWQMYPKRVFRSEELGVTFNDSLSLRLSIPLNDMEWEADFEGFNVRVSHQDELTPKLKDIQTELQEKVGRILSKYDHTLQYGVRILQLRKSPNGKVIVEYGIQLLPRNATDNSVDQSVVRDLVQVLVRSDLVTADNTTVTSIEGQFTCIEKKLTHPETKEELTLPYSGNGQDVSVIGQCHGASITMLTATCTYQDAAKKSSWECITFANCTTDCISMVITHSVTSENLTIPTGIDGDDIKVNGSCGDKEYTLMRAACSENSWQITELPCVLECPSNSLTHRQLPGRIPESSVSIGESFNTTMICNGQTITAMWAQCVSISNEKAEWHVNRSFCEIKCEPMKFRNSYTLQEFALPLKPLGSQHSLSMMCNGKVTYVNASCYGNLTDGATWHIESMPECLPTCPETSYYDLTTDRDYRIPETEHRSQILVKGFCGGEKSPIVLAECAGNIITGVQWKYEAYNCSPLCEEMNITHPDTGLTYTFPLGIYGGTYSIEGECNGGISSLITATCGGGIERSPKWTNIENTPCIGTCSSTTLSLDGREDGAVISEGIIGDEQEIIGLCAGLNFTQVEAHCDGNNSFGGQWRTQINKCKIDDNCPADRFPHNYTMQRINLPKTSTGEVIEVYGECNGDKIIMATATCIPRLGESGRWAVEFTDCVIEEANLYSNLMEAYYDDPKELARLTGQLTANITEPSPQLLSNIADITELIADPTTPKKIDTEGAYFFNIINNVMSLNASSLSSQGDKHNQSSASRLVKSVESFLDSSDMENSTAELVKDSLYIKAVNTSFINNPEGISLDTEDSEITLTPEIAEDSTVTFVKYDTGVLFGDSNQLLNGMVLSAQVSQKTVKDVNSAVTLKIKIAEDGFKGKPVCVYWNFTRDDWSTEGCKLTSMTNSSISCTCNHLTNFAILMDTTSQESYEQDDHHLAMSIITMVGLCVSIVALTLHLISFIFIAKLRENPFQKILANLALSILISNLVFITGITETGNQAVCITVAALLHYFITVSFAWMVVEAYMQYRRFVQVFGTHVTHILLKAGLPAWLCPTLPVVIILIIDPQLYKGGDQFCWMKPEALYYGFLLPIGCIIVVNLVLFSLILKGLLCGKKNQLRTNKSQSQLRNLYFKAAVAVFTLLGLTWIFGFLAMSQHTRLAFQYLFCITNSFQGLFIFLLHNIRDPKVVNWWRRTLHLKPKRRMASQSSGSTRMTTAGSMKDSGMSSIRKDTLKLPDSQHPRYKHLQQSKMYSSTESDSSNQSNATTTSDV